MQLMQELLNVLNEPRWKRLFDAILTDDTRDWQSVPRIAWPDGDEPLFRTQRFVVPRYYRVHSHPDPFRSDWEKHNLPKGWAHAGADPVHLIDTYGRGRIGGFLTAFSPKHSDLWCGDFGIQRKKFRCDHQLPRTADFAAQVAILRRYLRGYGDLRLYEFFHEVAVSRPTHPPAGRFLYRAASNGHIMTEISTTELDDFERWGGRLIASTVSFQPSPDIETEQMDPTDHYDGSTQRLVGGHPVAVFYAYLLLGFSSTVGFAAWVQCLKEKGLDEALSWLPAAGVFDPALSATGWSWFQTVEHYRQAIALHTRRLACINPNAPRRMDLALVLGAEEVMRECIRVRSPTAVRANFLSELKWQVDDYATDGRIKSSYMSRHNWN